MRFHAVISHPRVIMLHPSTQELIRKLCELTVSGHIAWKEGEGENCVFATEGYIVEVGLDPPHLRLLRADGRELERASDVDLAAVAWPEGEGTYATHVSDLASRARRIASGAEAAIERIMASLCAPASAPQEPDSPAHSPERGAAAHPAPAGPPSLMIRGVSARSVQTPDTGFPQPAPGDGPAPAQLAEPPPARGPSVYKPWN